MSTIRYVLRTDKPLKNGKSPIDLIYQVSGQRKYYRTNLKLFAENWNQEKQNTIYLDKKTAKKLLPSIDYDLLPTVKDVQDMNIELSQINNSISNIEKGFEINKIPYSSHLVIDKLKLNYSNLTKKEEHSNMVFDFIDQFIEESRSTKQPSSLAIYKTLKGHLVNYSKLSRKKVTFESLDFSFFQQFQNYLIDEAKLNNTTVAKQLSTIKTILNYAQDKHNIEVPLSYKKFSIKRNDLEVIALSAEEFERLYNLDLSKNKRLAETRDVFCFACVTGLRYSDLHQLKREHIKADEIKITVKKTKQHLTIPLTSYSRSILKRYEAMMKPIPVISNQNMNYAVKDLCKLAEINEPIEIVRYRGIQRESKIYPKYKLIGVHTGRKTFCTLSLEKGMSAEQVMSISGHSDYRSFKRYVNVTEQLKKVVMVKAWGKVKPVKTSKLKAV